MDEVQVLKMFTVLQYHIKHLPFSLLLWWRGRSICLNLQMKKPNRTFAETLELLVKASIISGEAIGRLIFDHNSLKINLPSHDNHSLSAIITTNQEQKMLFVELNNDNYVFVGCWYVSHTFYHLSMDEVNFLRISNDDYLQIIFEELTVTRWMQVTTAK